MSTVSSSEWRHFSPSNAQAFCNVLGALFFFDDSVTVHLCSTDYSVGLAVAIAQEIWEAQWASHMGMTVFCHVHTAASGSIAWGEHRVLFFA